MEKQEMQQIIEMLAIIEAKLDSDMEEMKADRKKDKEEMKAGRKKDKEEMRANQAKLLATMESDREEWRVGQGRLLEVRMPGRKRRQPAASAITLYNYTTSTVFNGGHPKTDLANV
jgi:hypothetical protein